MLYTDFYLFRWKNWFMWSCIREFSIVLTSIKELQRTRFLWIPRGNPNGNFGTFRSPECWNISLEHKIGWGGGRVVLVGLDEVGKINRLNKRLREIDNFFFLVRSFLSRWEFPVSKWLWLLGMFNCQRFLPRSLQDTFQSKWPYLYVEGFHWWSFRCDG